MLFNDYFLWNCEGKNAELSTRATIYLSIFKIGSILHWLNYSIKVSV